MQYTTFGETPTIDGAFLIENLKKFVTIFVLESYERLNNFKNYFILIL